MLWNLLKSWSSKVKNEQHVPKLFKSEIRAIQAWSQGTATPEQQKRAFDVVYYKVCLTGLSPYISGDEKANQFLAGRNHCGVALRDIAKIDPNNGIDDNEFFNKRK